MTMEKMLNSENPSNSYTQLSVANLFSSTVTSQDNPRNNMIEALYKTEQMNDEMVSKTKCAMLNKTTDALYKTEQMNDEMIKQLIESSTGKYITEEKFERVEIQDHSVSHQKTQLGFLTNKKEDIENLDYFDRISMHSKRS